MTCAHIICLICDTGLVYPQGRNFVHDVTLYMWIQALSVPAGRAYQSTRIHEVRTMTRTGCREGTSELRSNGGGRMRIQADRGRGIVEYRSSAGKLDAHQPLSLGVGNRAVSNRYSDGYIECNSPT